MTDKGETVPRLKVLGKPRDLPRELHDAGCAVFVAACREVGWDPQSYWSERDFAYVNRNPAPSDILWRAHRIACDAVGIPYEILTEDNGGTPS